MPSGAVFVDGCSGAPSPRYACTNNGVQAAFNDAFASNRPLLLPPGTIPISSLNFTGDVPVPQGFSIQGAGMGQTTLLCQESRGNTNVCIDMSGQNNTVWKDLTIQGGTSSGDSPQVVLLAGKTPGSNGSNHTFSNVQIRTYGSYGLYSYGAENLALSGFWAACFLNAPSDCFAPVVFSSCNANNIRSIYANLLPPPVSMTSVSWLGPSGGISFPAASYAGVWLDGDCAGSSLGNFEFSNTYWNNQDGRSSAAALAITTTLGQSVDNFAFTGRYESTNSDPFLLAYGARMVNSNLNVFYGGPRNGLPKELIAARCWINSNLKIRTGADVPSQIVSSSQPDYGTFVWISPYQNAAHFAGMGWTLIDGTAGPTNLQSDLNVTGWFSKGAGSFKIDDPLDPANKYLLHSFVESPDMMDVYNGTVRTDRLGLATVQLPSYFQALNGDYRYQLTVIGRFAQAIVNREIRNNAFEIRTNKPEVKVSWQVTGIRRDAYARANRLQVEQPKTGAEQGHYLHPELYEIEKPIAPPTTPAVRH